MPLDLNFTPEAVADLDAIFWIIAEDNPQRAMTYIAEIRQHCEILRDSPQIGAPRPDLRAGSRIWPFKRRVVVAYEIADHCIDILRVFYGGRDYEAIMSAGRPR